MHVRLATLAFALASTCIGAPTAVALSRPLVQEPAAAAPPASAADPRTLYDVTTYRLDVTVDPVHERLTGQMTMEARATADGVRAIELDLDPKMRVESVLAPDKAIDGDAPPIGAKLEYSRDGTRIRINLPAPLSHDATFRVAVVYSGEPRATNNFDGFHWAKTAKGEPWINTSCQGTGASAWWPCKDSFWHPEDKPERLLMNITVPAGLYAVSNGRLMSRTHDEKTETFHWRHEYPLETYSVTLNVAPYIVVEDELKLAGLDAPLKFIYYVLPEDLEKAKVSFAEVPRMLQVYGEAFGPFPFPKSKFALVETNFWGMEHSTAVAYGSSFPAWLKQNGGTDKFAGPDRFFDYILIHESAHEWWGNGVSAADWGDFWIHEGFATYAEGVYVEKTQGPERAEEYFAGDRRGVPAKGSLYRGKGTNSDEAYANIIYVKGCAVLHTLRQSVADDAAWWKSLRDFNLEFRYRNATTEDFRAVLERDTGRDWKRFFDEWVYGRGYPKVKGEVRAAQNAIEIEVDNEGSDGTDFHVPLVLAWKEAGKDRTQTVELAPGKTQSKIACKSKPESVSIVNLGKLLGKYDVAVK